ncbi:hypothetical protein I4U23_024793 [Adineta vaga]|nr:hypothetical protein I4U23_024793 [Adineta vaga]
MMNTIEHILWILQIVVAVLILCFALLYSIPLIFIRRFQQHNNILTLNFSLITVASVIYWISYFVIIQANQTIVISKHICAILNIIQTLVTLQFSFSIVTISIHRCCLIIYYNKFFFKSKRWVIICLCAQWILALILSFLTLIYSEVKPLCSEVYWLIIYRMVTSMIIPTIAISIINIVIFNHVRSSSRRVQPQGQFPVVPVQEQKISRRDIYLLRHLIFIFCIYIIGWTPLCLIPLITYGRYIELSIYLIFSVLSELCLLCVVIDLFFYNHDMKKYLINLIFHRA